jgi:hypothetical protein
MLLPLCLCLLATRALLIYGNATTLQCPSLAVHLPATNPCFDLYAIAGQLLDTWPQDYFHWQ